MKDSLEVVEAPTRPVRKSIKRKSGIGLKRKPRSLQRRVGVSTRKKKTHEAKLKEKLWELCKAIVRKRQENQDGSWNCYTCNVVISKPIDAHTAHFVARSLCGAGLRYSLDNLRVCCGNCNVWKSGNWPAYYEHMVQEVGQEEVDRIISSRKELVKTNRKFYEDLIYAYNAILDGYGETKERRTETG